jgi:hypothetical protein
LLNLSIISCERPIPREEQIFLSKAFSSDENMFEELGLRRIRMFHVKHEKHNQRMQRIKQILSVQSFSSIDSFSLNIKAASELTE